MMMQTMMQTSRPRRGAEPAVVTPKTAARMSRADAKGKAKAKAKAVGKAASKAAGKATAAKAGARGAGTPPRRRAKA